MRPLLLAAIHFVLGACVASPFQPRPGELYAALGERDLVLAVDTMQRALENKANGEGMTWDNEGSGNSGSITPLRTFMTTGGYPCRSYAERLEVDGRAGTYENTACRNEAGAWIWVEEPSGS